jgi:hypothetical protein
MRKEEKMHSPYYLGTIAILAIGGCPYVACAQDIGPVEQDSIETVTAPNNAQPDPVDIEVIAEAPVPVFVEDNSSLSDQELDAARGGSTIVVGNQTLNAVNSGGVINGDFSAGSISLADNALTNFNGFGNLVINTGAQNNLQSGMNVTINFAN